MVEQGSSSQEVVSLTTATSHFFFRRTAPSEMCLVSAHSEWKAASTDLGKSCKLWVPGMLHKSAYLFACLLIKVQLKSNAERLLIIYARISSPEIVGK